MMGSRNEWSGKLIAKLWSTRLSLLVERLESSFSWLLIWIAIFLIAALSGLNGLFFSILFWLGFVGLLAKGILTFRPPLPSEIKARIEQESHIRHRPLRSADDTPSGSPSAVSRTLWRVEMQRRLGLLPLLRWVHPRFNWVRRDPYAVRIGLILLLIVGVVIAGPAGPDKIRQLLIPFDTRISRTSSDPVLKVLITPPPYTRKAHIMLTGRPDKPVALPEKSDVKVMAQSWLGHLSLQAGDETIPLHKEGKTDLFAAKATIKETDAIKVRQFGLPRLTIPVTFIKDTPPIISLRGQPETIIGGQLRLPLTIQDDYGLKLIRVRAILSPSVQGIPLGNQVYEEQSIIVPSDGKPLDINPLFDLTGHPWAGYPVSLLIEAEDHAGQSAQAGPVDIVLPERIFRHPVARMIVDIRKMLIRKGDIGAAASVMALDSLLARPQNYGWDTVTTLALRSAASRLMYQSKRDEIESVVNLLWFTALHLEDGNLTTSQKDVREALKNLQKAMQEKKSPEEIARLMQEFQDALSNYLSAMQQQLQKKVAQGEITPISPDMMTQVLDSSMLGDFLNQLENEMMNGDIEAAMKKLENLQKITDMMNPAMAQSLPEDIKKEMQNLKDVQKIIDRQQTLLDKTRSLQSDAQTRKEKFAQEEIGADLTKMMPSDGKAPPALDRAGESMKQSAQQLGQNHPQDSIPHQQDALDSLREGRKQMQQALQQKFQGMTGFSFGAPRAFDPLGKGRSGNSQNIFEDGVKIPTGPQRRKTDDILKALREKSSDLNRPTDEREYYRRLLRQW
jgi:uncharacterized protein (TIGR02302 family)